MNEKYIEKNGKRGEVVHGHVHKHLCLEDISMYAIEQHLLITLQCTYGVCTCLLHGVHVPHSE